MIDHIERIAVLWIVCAFSCFLSNHHWVCAFDYFLGRLDDAHDNKPKVVSKQLFSFWLLFEVFGAVLQGFPVDGEADVDDSFQLFLVVTHEEYFGYGGVHAVEAVVGSDVICNVLHACIFPDDSIDKKHGFCIVHASPASELVVEDSRDPSWVGVKLEANPTGKVCSPVFEGCRVAMKVGGETARPRGISAACTTRSRALHWPRIEWLS